MKRTQNALVDYRSSLLVAGAALLVAMPSCGGDDDPSTGTRSGSGGSAAASSSGNSTSSSNSGGSSGATSTTTGNSGGAAGASADGFAGAPSEAEPLFAIASTQFGPDSSTTVLQLIEDPRADVSLSVSTGIELPGTTALYGTEGTGRVVVGNSDGPTLTEYILGDAGDQLVEGRSLSLQQYGINSGFIREGLVPFVAPDRAYFLHDSTLQGIIWNPEEMTIEGSFSLEEAEQDGLFFELGERAVERDGLLFVGANQRREDDGEAGQAMVLVIDPETDSLDSIITDDRCGNTLHVVNHEGTLYVASGTIAAIVELQGHQPDYPSPCMLRILPGELSFDASYHVVLEDVLGGNPGGRLVPSRNGKAFVTALHVDELDPAAIGPEADFWAPWDAAVWHWWEVTLGSDASGVELTEAPPSSAGGRVIAADGEHFIQHRADSQTSFYTANEDGVLQKGVTVPGVPYGLVRVR